MLATLTHDAFSDEAWIYERKLDGERVLASRDGGEVRLLSRNRKTLNAEYPEIADALGGLGVDDFIVDGEMVAFDGKVTSFARLQQRMHNRPQPGERRTVAVFYYVFDVLYLAGHDTCNLPLRDRKRLLRAAFAFEAPLRLTPHRNRDGEAYLVEACEKRWEGLIAKRADAPYVHTRSRDWLKFKCQHGQEFVVGGFTEPRGTRTGFGALLLGYYDGDDLVYAGKVGTGFDDATLARLGERLESLEREASPFAEFDGERGVHWVRPEVVAEVRFTEWTRDGRLRHPAFLGTRRDKDAREVRREG